MFWTAVSVKLRQYGRQCVMRSNPAGTFALGSDGGGRGALKLPAQVPGPTIDEGGVPPTCSTSSYSSSIVVWPRSVVRIRGEPLHDQAHLEFVIACAPRLRNAPLAGRERRRNRPLGPRLHERARVRDVEMSGFGAPPLGTQHLELPTDASSLGCDPPDRRRRDRQLGEVLILVTAAERRLCRAVGNRPRTRPAGRLDRHIAHRGVDRYQREEKHGGKKGNQPRNQAPFRGWDSVHRCKANSLAAW